MLHFQTSAIDSSPAVLLIEKLQFPLHGVFLLNFQSFLSTEHWKELLSVEQDEPQREQLQYMWLRTWLVKSQTRCPKRNQGVTLAVLDMAGNWELEELQLNHLNHSFSLEKGEIELFSFFLVLCC